MKHKTAEEFVIKFMVNYPLFTEDGIIPLKPNTLMELLEKCSEAYHAQFSQEPEGRANKEKPLTFAQFCESQGFDCTDLSKYDHREVNEINHKYEGYLIGLKHTSPIHELGDSMPSHAEMIKASNESYEHHPDWDCFTEGVKWGINWLINK